MGDVLPLQNAAHARLSLPSSAPRRRATFVLTSSSLERARAERPSLFRVGTGSNQKMSFRLLAVDLDGTLIDAAGAVHAPDREAIAALAAKGIPTTIITGRLFSGTRRIAGDVGTTGPVACVDGCHVVEAASG